MVKILFITLPEQKKHEVEAVDGANLMEVAVTNGIDRIIGECGGACSCATCHVYIDESWLSAVGEPSPMEEDMLDFAYNVRSNSRLSCQVTVTNALQGLVVYIPEP